MAAIRHGVDELLSCIREYLSKLPPIVKYEAEPEIIKPVEEFEKTAINIRVEDNVYIVEGNWLIQLINSVNFSDSESLQYFQRVLINTGVIDALRDAGINEGDTVSMYDLEFDFVN